MSEPDFKEIFYDSQARIADVRNAEEKFILGESKKMNKNRKGDLYGKKSTVS